MLCAYVHELNDGKIGRQEEISEECNGIQFNDKSITSADWAGVPWPGRKYRSPAG